MSGEILVNATAAQGFALLLARLASAILLIPFPGLRSAPAMPKVVLSLGLTIVVAPFAPPHPRLFTVAELALAFIAELALGIAIGLLVAFVFEGLQLAAQLIGLQAGFSYASTVDPQSQADSAVLQVVVQLLSGLLFLSLGLDRYVLGAVVALTTTIPPGFVRLPAAAGDSVIRAGASMFTLGLRAALPTVAVLLVTDVLLALLSRMNSHLQMLGAAFPIKILTGVVTLAALLPLVPDLLKEALQRVLPAIGALAR